jgi:hypothetical protein
MLASSGGGRIGGRRPQSDSDTNHLSLVRDTETTAHHEYAASGHGIDGWALQLARRHQS